MKPIHIPDPLTRILLDHQFEANQYFEKWQGKKDSLDIMLDFAKTIDKYEEIKEILEVSGCM